MTTASRVAYADDRAMAQQLFQQGKELMKSGKVAEACPKFEAAQQFSATPGVRLNLADCWVKLGRTASAWSKFDEALGIAERNGDVAAADLARKAKAALEPQLTYLTVAVAPDAAVLPGLTVQRDGEALPAATWGLGIPVDPGPHQFSAQAPGRLRWTRTETTTSAGGKITVTVPLLTVDPAASRAVASTIDLADDPSHKANTRRLLGWITGGVGVVGLGVASYFLADALSDKSDYKSQLTSRGQCASAACGSDSHAAYVAGNVATGAYIAGGVLVAAGVALLLTAPARAPSTPASASLVPLVAPGSGGLSLVGAW